MSIAAQALFLILATVVAFWTSAIAGGGASLMLIPLLNLLLPVAEVPFALTIGTFSSSASRVAVFRAHIHWRGFRWFVPFSIPAVLLGALLIKHVNPLYLQLLVGFLLLLNLPELFRKKAVLAHEGRPYPNAVLGLAGFLAGFISGITGAIGLLFNRFYLRYGLSKEEIVGTRAANEVLLHAIKLCVYLALGLYSTRSLLLGLAVAVGAIASSITVKRILPHLSEVLFRRIGYAAMVLAGAFLLTSAARQVVEKDRIRLSTKLLHQGGETTIQWRNSAFILEFNLDDGLEVERPIGRADLPPALQAHYDSLSVHCDHLLVESVHRFRAPVGYEFYCDRAGQTTKLEFK